MLDHWFLPRDLPLSLCLHYSYDVRLVGLSYLVAVFAAFTAFHLIDRVRAASGVTQRRLWLATGGVCMGLGIWAMHFIAMLAVQIAIPIGYDFTVIAASSAVAMAGAGVALALVVDNRRLNRRRRLVAAGLILGVAIAGMHYSGMSALRMPASVYYRPAPFALSAVLAVALSTASLFTLGRTPRLLPGRPLLARVAAAAIMGLAIAIMHYSGMLAAVFFPQVAAGHGWLALNAPRMAWAVAVVSLLLLALALVVALFDAERRGSRDFTAAVINNLPGFFALVDRAGRLVLWNDNLSAITGLSSEDMRGREAEMIAIESDRAMVRTVFAEAFASGFAEVEFRVATERGPPRTVRWSGQLIVRDRRPFLLAIGLDMTASHLAQSRLLESEQQFRAIFSSVNDGIIVHDADTAAFIDANASLCEMFGYSREELLGLSQGELSADGAPFTKGFFDLPAGGSVSTEAAVFEWHCKAKNGRRFWVEVSVRRAAFGAQDVLLSTTRDITERKRANAQITHLARHDHLTGLPNRAVFVEALATAIDRARREGCGLAVLYLDLDHFKDVNDTLGHPIGDRLLQAVANRLRIAVRQVDTVARFGGDEFAVILTNVGDATKPESAAAAAATAVGVAVKILDTLRQPYLIEGNAIRSSATVGISVWGRTSSTAEAMLSHADVALYRAKAEQRGACRVFTDAMDTEVRARVAIAADLRTAIEAKQFFLAYQPQVDIDTGAIVGLEALVRWRHPTRGVLAPGAFIAAAETNGLIVPLGLWVLREACGQMRRWIDEGVAPRAVAVNVSGVQFKSPHELESDIQATLEISGLPASRLELELTESVLMETSRAHNDTLLRLREQGHRLAVDDFGSGYSSLEYLRRYPVDRIKIDHGFIAEIGGGNGSDAIVRVALDLARALKIEAVIEGVETASQLDLVRNWGGRVVQGYYFARPAPAEEVTRLLRAGVILRSAAQRSGVESEVRH